MSDLFDNLARNLAKPMPRRRVLRLLGSAVAVAALPSLRPGSASANGKLTCKASEELCTNGTGTSLCMPAGGRCCEFGPESGYKFGLLVGCGPGYTCGSGRPNDQCVCKGEECRGRCCGKNQHCDDDGVCSSCPSARQCGGTCCREGAVCRDDGSELCCVKSWRVCDKEGRAVKCCPPLDECCFNTTKKTYTCCDAKHPCEDGRCTCAKNETRCGDGDCCTANEVCSQGKCCPKGRVNCGGKCCDKDDCCGGVCCDGTSRICVNGKCCDDGRFMGNGRCCPRGTVAGNGPNRNTCCPEDDPNCCRDGGFKVGCGKGRTCVRGTCRKL